MPIASNQTAYRHGEDSYHRCYASWLCASKKYGKRIRVSCTFLLRAVLILATLRQSGEIDYELVADVCRAECRHAKICESLGMENFLNAPIKSPFVKFEQLEPDGGFAIIDASERLEMEERLKLIVRNMFKTLPEEPTAEYLKRVLNPILPPMSNPLGCLELYKKFALPNEEQQSLKNAGNWPSVYGPVKSSAHNLHQLRWSACLSFAVQKIISFLTYTDGEGWLTCVGARTLEVARMPGNLSQTCFNNDTYDHTNAVEEDPYNDHARHRNILAKEEKGVQKDPLRVLWYSWSIA
ncbi:hypothetical protein AUP68_16930 [Ilyonectria robusta]